MLLPRQTIEGTRCDFTERKWHVDRRDSRRQRHAIDSRMSTVVLESVLSCPNCGFARQETMPTDACQFFYECSNCGSVLRPKPGDCCVFCSYGSVKCPPIQEHGECCNPG
jgi:hypothetical protein